MSDTDNSWVGHNFLNVVSATRKTLALVSTYMLTVNCPTADLSVWAGFPWWHATSLSPDWLGPRILRCPDQRCIENSPPCSPFSSWLLYVWIYRLSEHHPFVTTEMAFHISSHRAFSDHVLFFRIKNMSLLFLLCALYGWLASYLVLSWYYSLARRPTHFSGIF